MLRRIERFRPSEQIGGETERALTALQDEWYNTTALVYDNGDVRWRYRYGAHGKVTPMYDNGSTAPNPGAVDEWNVLFGGYYRDEETGLYHVRRRMLHPTLGTWLQPDPMGYADGPNLYLYGRGSSATFVDPSGEWVESAWDAASLGVGLWSFAENVEAGNIGWALLDLVGIAADTAALILPIVPGGVSMGIRALRAGGMAIDVAKTTRRIVTGVDYASDAIKLADLGVNAYQAYDAYQQENYLGAGLGALGFGIRIGQADFMSLRRFVPGVDNGRWMTSSQVANMRRLEYRRLREHDFTPAQARYLLGTYKDGVGHHYPITQRLANRLRLPDVLWKRNPLNVRSPLGMSRGRFYELHYRVDPFFHYAPFPKKIGGGWTGRQLDIQKFGSFGRAWFGTPTALKVIGGTGLAGFGGSASLWWESE